MMIQHRTNLPFAIDAASPLVDPTIMLTITTSPSSSPTSSATAFFGQQHLRLDDSSFESIDTAVSSEFSLSSSSSSSSTSFSLKQRNRKPRIKQMKNHIKHNFNPHHYHHRNDFLFCGPNENGGFVLANTTTTTPKQQQQQSTTNMMDLLPQHSSSGRPIIEFTFASNVIPERLLVPLL